MAASAELGQSIESRNLLAPVLLVIHCSSRAVEIRHWNNGTRYALDVAGTIKASSTLIAGQSGSNGVLSLVNTSGGAVGYLAQYGSETRIQNTDGTGYVSVWTNSGSNSEKVRITNAGNVGIGTTNPGTLLELAGSTPVLRLTDSAGPILQVLVAAVVICTSRLRARPETLLVNAGFGQSGFDGEGFRQCRHRDEFAQSLARDRRTSARFANSTPGSPAGRRHRHRTPRFQRT